MKLSNSYFFSKKENVKDEESISSNLLTRAGMIKKAGNGIYYFLPLGLRVFRNIENVIREEMDSIGSQELVMPSLLPEDYFINSGRREIFGDNMFALKDRYGRDYVLGPTHEELFAEAAKEVIKSYKDMPVSLYQMANKYRDEPRPRYGLLRTREFVMKDAYSFDKDQEGVDKSYQLMFDAYKRIFDKCGLDYCIVRASSGAMGGDLSEEFQAFSEIGEDIVVSCSECGLSTNIEVCDCKEEKIDNNEEIKEKELLHTPNCGTIKDLEDNFNIKAKDTVKTLIYKCDNKFYAILIRGDREVNEYKVSKLLGAINVEMASAEEDEKVTGAVVGFAGPIGLDVPIIADYEIMNMKNFLVGANKDDYHYINTNLKDFKIDQVGDLRNITEEDVCPKCGSKLTFKKSIEVGNTFKLGTKYSEAMNLYFTDEYNNLKPVIMGSYGIGPARVLAAYIEQNHDDKGIIFNDVLTPYKVCIVIANNKDEGQVSLANKIYDELTSKGISVLLDDRDVRAGVKFNDMDLIGITNRIVVGKKASEDIVEFKKRKDSESIEIKTSEIINQLQ